MEGGYVSFFGFFVCVLAFENWTSWREAVAAVVIEMSVHAYKFYHRYSYQNMKHEPCASDNV